MHDHHHHEDKELPKPVLYAAGGLMIFSLAVAFIGKAAGVGEKAMPVSTPVARLEVVFEDLRMDGLEVREASRGELIGRVAHGRDGFIRGVLRGLNRERRLENLPKEAPFVLTQWADGRISILDPSTSRSVELVGFGRTNFETFARVLASAEP